MVSSLSLSLTLSSSTSLILPWRVAVEAGVFSAAVVVLTTITGGSTVNYCVDGSVTRTTGRRLLLLLLPVNLCLH